MSTRRLNPRQREIRKMLIREKGLVSPAELADQFRVSRQQIWRDIKRIEAHAPPPPDGWNELEAVQQSIREFRQQLQRVDDELEICEREAAARSGRKSSTGIYAVRARLLDERRRTLEGLNQFLLQIGYISEVPRHLILEKRLADLEGPELDAHIENLEAEAARRHADEHPAE
jgi:predicted ATP-dependent endonuclease of OLD family